MTKEAMLRYAILCAGLVVATVVGAQSPTSAAPEKSASAAKAAKSGSSSKSAPSATKRAANGFKLVLEPRAMDLLKATSQRLASAKTLSFTATVGYEYPSKLGPPIVYTTRYDVTMHRPDKLRILMPGDGPASEFYYDGKTMVAYAPVENLAAVSDAPPTVDAALVAAYKTAAIFFPFTDLLLSDPYAAFSNGPILAFYIGPSSVIGGTKTDMIAWANNDVFLQIWIGADDKLPRRIRAMFREDKLGLRHEMEISNWQLDAPVAAETFASAKAQSAGRMEFAAPAPPPKGVKPIVKGMTERAPTKDATQAK